MLAHSERVNSLATIQLWLDLARSRPRTLLSHGAKPQAPDRSEEPLILRQPDEPLPLTPLCRDRADALRCPSSFHTIARRSLRARSHLRPPRLATRPCRRGSALASDPCAFCRSIRDALRGTSLPVTSLRSCRVGVARIWNPASRGSLLSLLPRSPPFRGEDRRLLSRSGVTRLERSRG